MLYGKIGETFYNRVPIFFQKMLYMTMICQFWHACHRLADPGLWERGGEGRLRYILMMLYKSKNRFISFFFMLNNLHEFVHQEEG